MDAPTRTQTALMLYTETDLNNWFPHRYLARGRRYYNSGRVSSLAIEENDTRITARVTGSRARPYGVSVHIASGKQGRVSIHGSCTCPIGYNCKHVAAVLLQALEETEHQKIPALQPTVTSPSPPLAETLPAQLSGWFQRLSTAVQSQDGGEYPDTVRDRILYLLSPDKQNATKLKVAVVAARLLKGGGYGQLRTFASNRLAYGQTPKFVTSVDTAIIRDLMMRRATADKDHLHGMEGAVLLERMVETGRCHWESPQAPPLSLGEERDAQISWVTDTQGLTRLTLQTDPPAPVFPLHPLWYIDVQQELAGLARINMPVPLAIELITSPALKPEELARVSRWLTEHLPDVSVPPPPELKIEIIKDLQPQPILNLYTRHLSWAYETYPVEAARLSFDYDGQLVELDDQTAYFSRYEHNRVVQFYRNPDTEAACLRVLAAAGFNRLSVFHDSRMRVQNIAKDLGLASEADWVRFMLEDVPRLRNEGWIIQIQEGFRFNLVGPDEWYAELDERSGIDWFGLALGVEIEGQSVNLLPLLVDFMHKHAPRNSLREWLNGLADDERLTLPLGDGRWLSLPVSRIKAILGVLIELYDEPALDDEGDLTLPRIQAARLAELEAALQGETLRWQGGEALLELAQRLRNAKVPEKVKLPKGLQAELRPYQQRGLAWLQFLRQYELAGILADDMGLGKTVQALAHLLIEKTTGRSDRPTLVVAPTSLMTNWRLEAARFTPALQVLTLHGPQRRNHFKEIPNYDVVLTTYALLPRDQKELQRYSYHLLILDESQAIKNPKVQAGKVARGLDVRHRLCLTGTPMENHLGELWSMFDFLMPGLLGNEFQFRRLFRRPIEQFGDTERRELLARRIAPFTLRRSKEQVAKELPAKTEIVRTVELHDAQRDLYESIRVAMQHKVRQTIQHRGLARSHIVILDALLKLRQVCCDPRLLRLEATKQFKFKRSAKLDLLLELLDNLLAEGRRVLLFSQFTTMLGLIEIDLTRRKIAYTKLTGQTRDRATPVEHFQAGKVPLFLISLKAGGTGLNLTAADTVIHYDPWWNPAVEDQATDRAHRIGQDKPVFVYKLFTEGTVEEKIRELQARKRALTDGVLAAKDDTKIQWTDQDLDFLFAPLE